jgi:hypothetical protein
MSITGISLQSAGIWIKPKFHMMEKILSGLLILLFCIKIFSPASTPVPIILAINLLAMLYFVYAFAPLDDSDVNGLNNLTKFITNWGISGLLIAAFFFLNGFPGFGLMLINGTIVMGLSTAIIIYLLVQKKPLSKFMFYTLTRSLIYLAIGLTMLLMPKDFPNKYHFIIPHSTEQIK